MTDLLTRLLALAELAVDEALQFEYGDPDDRHIWRELQELKPLVAGALAKPEPEWPSRDDLRHFFYLHCDSSDDCAHWLECEPFVDAALGVLTCYARPAIEPVPEGPTDEEACEWYSYCPEDGIELHSSKELAQKAAQEIMGSYAKAAYSDGWHEDMESVSWGKILPVEQAQVVERTKAEPDSGFDEFVQYALVPARWCRPAIEPVPVAERLPGPEDCDEEGRCWLFYTPISHGIIPDGMWVFRHQREILQACYTHWLPHHALPVPQP